ncbi:MAG: 30S ribosomal protein S27ae [Nitrososphaerales archaeon]|jgi:small subunit ribosomal protein S27Ae
MGKKGQNTTVWKYYKIEGEAVKRLKRECPRCGKGVFMGEHKDRVACGRCGYTEFKKR